MSIPFTDLKLIFKGEKQGSKCASQPHFLHMGQIQGLHNRGTEKPELPCSLPARNTA